MKRFESLVNRYFPLVPLAFILAIEGIVLIDVGVHSEREAVGVVCVIASWLFMLIAFINKE